MRIAVFGGSFNPPHLCHVLAVALALSTDEVDRVLAVPTFAHAFDKALAPFAHRLAMCRLTFAPFGDRVQISTVERDLGKTSRTLRTLEHLRAKHPEWSFRLLIGGDILEERESWHRFDAIERLAPPLVIGRRGHGAEDEAAGIALPDISSTQIRERLARGQSVRGLVPAAVDDYVRAHSLYGAGPGEA